VRGGAWRDGRPPADEARRRRRAEGGVAATRGGEGEQERGEGLEQAGVGGDEEGGFHRRWTRRLGDGGGGDWEG
jgi:hypothetical protein